MFHRRLASLEKGGGWRGRARAFGGCRGGESRRGEGEKKGRRACSRSKIHPSKRVGSPAKRNDTGRAQGHSHRKRGAAAREEGRGGRAEEGRERGSGRGTKLTQKHGPAAGQQVPGQPEAHGSRPSAKIRGPRHKTCGPGDTIDRGVILHIRRWAAARGLLAHNSRRVLPSRGTNAAPRKDPPRPNSGSTDSAEPGAVA